MHLHLQKKTKNCKDLQKDMTKDLFSNQQLLVMKNYTGRIMQLSSSVFLCAPLAACPPIHTVKVIVIVGHEGHDATLRPYIKSMLIYTLLNGEAVVVSA